MDNSNNLVSLQAEEISRLRERDKLCSVLLVAFGALLGTDPFDDKGSISWTSDKNGAFKRIEIPSEHAAQFAGRQLNIQNGDGVISIGFREEEPVDA